MAARTLDGAANESVPLGRIEAQKSEVAAAFEAWSVRVKTRLKPASYYSYVKIVESALRDNPGWTRLDDLTFDAITAYIDGKLNAGDWARLTYNKNLRVLRDFTRFVTKARRRAGQADAADPLEDAEPQPGKDSSAGGRAATTEEARALLRYTCAREEADSRATGSRSIIRACMFLAGMRPGEPERLRWKHVNLDHSTPFFTWTPEVNKNGRKEFVPIAPELTELLRAHRDRLRERVKSDGGVEVSRDRRNKTSSLRRYDPDDPEAFVVPKTTSGCQWAKDVRKARIKEADWRGLPFTPKAARRWHETTLVKAGVPQNMVDALMRHAVTVPRRYFDPTLEELAEKLSVLPKLWPGMDLRTIDEGHAPRNLESRLTDESEKSIVNESWSRSEADFTDPSASKSTRTEPRASRRVEQTTAYEGSMNAGPRPASSEPVGPLPLVESVMSNLGMPRGGLEPPTSGL